MGDELLFWLVLRNTVFFKHREEADQVTGDPERPFSPFLSHLPIQPSVATNVDLPFPFLLFPTAVLWAKLAWGKDRRQGAQPPHQSAFPINFMDYCKIWPHVSLYSCVFVIRGTKPPK